ncbi:MAG: 1-deoxy-D-xylulose-5-phosphate synthase [Desulfarculales bacterium]|jgi:1-deoxy-D-xylulose-5-phosphate synthase|nr:1-deoxy-D-xylulose-5-phosphate synthase [Desulfarculales bacterium]
MSFNILNRINSPLDLEQLSNEEMLLLAEEVRVFIIEVVRKNGGHLSSSLGVVELTLALLKVFPQIDHRIVWDVGHQAYAYKILTGRRDAFPSLRQLGGLSGFPKMSESPYDAFDTGHSSTSISLAVGIAQAKKRKGETGRVLAVIGDGALTSGLAFEGLNQAGYLYEDMIVVLNDNGMSIAPNVGALSRFMARALSGKAYHSFRRELRRVLTALPGIGQDLVNLARRSENSIKALSTPGILFEAFHFNYVGPVEGHNLPRLIEVFNNLADVPGPILVHVLTQKGHGYEPAEANPRRFHGLSVNFYMPSQIENADSRRLNYTQAFGQSLLKLAQKDDRIIGITAAMPEGTGLDELARSLPGQYMDVGIAEQHAVTLAAGMASQGLRPVVAIYSTFMQRAYDQIAHDVCIPGLPVVLALDRAGIVGEDGASHQGLLDISFLRSLPNLSLLAPSNENELGHMLASALQHNGPVAIRYPRGAGLGVPLDDDFHLLPWGKGEVLRTGKDLLILALGNRVAPAFQAAAELSAGGLEATVINARFVKPLDMDLITHWAGICGRILTVEENMAAGGFGSAVLEGLHKNGVMAPVKIVAVDDVFIEHGSPEKLRALHGLDQAGIVRAALALAAE